MLTRSSLNFILAVVALLAFSASASAQADLGPQKNAATSSSQLNITANAVKAIQLDISTAATGATVVVADPPSRAALRPAALPEVPLMITEMLDELVPWPE